ncbi:leucine-rich repeat-containing protein 43-like [Carcharodon carcharias]|uniref:leucine-rich repeat-containing protein 43-like n=1 Tax=Carcharodon carcharias TaxID=13397 RepID=UPI001B7DEC6A|nr:leucine-rich repeat-containing protein 43-like [Carcharodon carcharias]
MEVERKAFTTVIGEHTYGYLNIGEHQVLTEHIHFVYECLYQKLEKISHQRSTETTIGIDGRKGITGIHTARQPEDREKRKSKLGQREGTGEGHNSDESSSSQLPIQVFVAPEPQEISQGLAACGHRLLSVKNSSKHSTKKTKKFKLLKYHGEKQEAKGNNVNEEDPEALKEYLTCEQSPWKTEHMSPEMQHLRELAITSPALMNECFLCSYLKSLRIVDKQVCEVDKNMLKFQNLEELILSVNRITTLNSANLPRKLKVIELCSNDISSLKELCCNPPPMLQYLGLSHNKLSLDSEYNYLSEVFWPNLISLDLSFNDFVNLRNVAFLNLLPNLKNLIFLGNPLALLPNYRGFIIDTLKNLISLDDVLISPDERHHFKGIAKQHDFFVPVSQITIDIGKVTGIPKPIDPLEELPEFPIIKRSYFVTYEFLGYPEIPHRLNEPDRKDELVDIQSETPVNGTLSEKDTSSPQVIHTPVLDNAADTAPIESKQAFQVFTHKLPQKPWGDPIIYNYTKMHLVRELYALKQLLQNGLTVTIIEEKILSWPIETEDDKISETSTKRKYKDSAKGTKHSGKDTNGKDNIKDKKKPPVSLQSDPPIQKILGDYHIDLYSIVTGNHFFEMVCDLGVPKIEEKVKSPTPDIKRRQKEEETLLHMFQRESSLSISLLSLSYSYRSG